MFSFKLKSTTAIYCPYCHSPLVSHQEPAVKEDMISHSEVYGVECKVCGAAGMIHEIWPLPKGDADHEQ